ncbi:MAG TPA: type II toxin-antitoxin system VapC family toxin [Trueperaceae bacterium]|nr:type II toxin-antitoxin system VapC family toxin [Trueperaceae bacterium]
MTFVLDTDTVSYYLRGEGRVAEYLLAAPRGRVFVTAVTIFELWRGARLARLGERRERALRDFLDSFIHLPLGTREAERAAQVTATLEAQGTPIGRFDTLIAGIALVAGAALVTRNEAHFTRVPGLEVVNWYE